MKIKIVLIMCFVFQACDSNSINNIDNDEQFIEETIDYEICNYLYSSDGTIGCDDDCQLIDGKCYYDNDINFLWELLISNNIDSSHFRLCDDFNNAGSDCLGQQTWSNGRLVELDLDKM